MMYLAVVQGISSWIYLYIFREMLDNCTAPKHQKLSSSEHQLLTELLIKKDADLKAAMKVIAL